MKRFSLVLMLLFSLSAFVISGCGRRLPETPVASNPTTAPTEATEEATPEAEATPLAEDSATEEAEATEEVLATEETEATEEAEAAPAASDALVGDVANGEALFTMIIPNVGMNCTSCHNANTQDRLVGPGLQGIGTAAASRVAGQSAEEYLRNSIIHPSDYVVETYPDLVMPQTYEANLTEQELADLVAYLLSL